MASYVYKKIPIDTVASFCEEWGRRNATPQVWKAGPYMRSAKFGPVTVTFWEQKRTLMFQGPIGQTSNLNEQFIRHKQRTKADETKQTGEAPRKNNQEHNYGIIPSPEPWKTHT